MLSSHGRRLVEYARHILAINDEALRALQDGPLEGDLRLGAPLDVADTILPTLLMHIARSAPRVKLEIRTDRSPFLMDALRAGEIDLTISTRFDQDFEGVALRTSPTVWLASADYVHDPHAPVPLVLADEPSIFRRLALNALEQGARALAYQLRGAEPGGDKGGAARAPGRDGAQRGTAGTGDARAG